MPLPFYQVGSIHRPHIKAGNTLVRNASNRASVRRAELPNLLQKSVCRGVFTNSADPPRIHGNVNRPNTSVRGVSLTGSEVPAVRIRFAGCKELKPSVLELEAMMRLLCWEMPDLDLSSRTGHQGTDAKYRTIMCRLQANEIVVKTVQSNSSWLKVGAGIP